jgi:hypothetical protein
VLPHAAATPEESIVAEALRPSDSITSATTRPPYLSRRISASHTGPDPSVLRECELRHSSQPALLRATAVQFRSIDAGQPDARRKVQIEPDTRAHLDRVSVDDAQQFG